MTTSGPDNKSTKKIVAEVEAASVDPHKSLTSETTIQVIGNAQEKDNTFPKVVEAKADNVVKRSKRLSGKSDSSDEKQRGEKPAEWLKMLKNKLVNMSKRHSYPTDNEFERSIMNSASSTPPNGISRDDNNTAGKINRRNVFETFRSSTDSADDTMTDKSVDMDEKPDLDKGCDVDDEMQGKTEIHIETPRIKSLDNIVDTEFNNTTVHNYHITTMEDPLTHMECTLTPLGSNLTLLENNLTTMDNTLITLENGMEPLEDTFTSLEHTLMPIENKLTSTENSQTVIESNQTLGMNSTCEMGMNSTCEMGMLSSADHMLVDLDIEQPTQIIAREMTTEDNILTSLDNTDICNMDQSMDNKVLNESMESKHTAGNCSVLCDSDEDRTHIVGEYVDEIGLLDTPVDMYHRELVEESLERTGKKGEAGGLCISMHIGSLVDTEFNITTVHNYHITTMEDTPLNNLHK